MTLGETHLTGYSTPPADEQIVEAFTVNANDRDASA